MTGSGDEMAAAGDGRMRASDADREQAIEALKVAFTQGRLDKDEFDARVAQVFASRTQLQLAKFTSDIPAVPIPPRPLKLPRPPRPPRPPVSKGVRSGLAVITVSTVLTAALWAVALFTGNATVFMMAATITIAYAGCLFLAGAVMLDSRQGRQRKRGTGQLSSRRPLGQIGA